LRAAPIVRAVPCAQLTKVKANADRQPLDCEQPGKCLGRHESTKATHSGTRSHAGNGMEPCDRDYIVRVGLIC
jgi:hypothetical protein